MLLTWTLPAILAVREPNRTLEPGLTAVILYLEFSLEHSLLYAMQAIEEGTFQKSKL